MSDAPDPASPAAVLDALERTYVRAAAVDAALDLDRVVAACRDGEPSSLSAVVDAVADAVARSSADLAVEFDALKRAVAADGSTGRVRSAALVLAAATLSDAAVRHPGLERAAAVDAVDGAAAAGAPPDAVVAAGRRVARVAAAVAAGDRLAAEVGPESHARPGRAAERIAAAVRTGDPERVRSAAAEVSADREWTRSDLLAFDPDGFESLLARCWRAYHNAAETTRASRDRGIDVVVRTSDGDRLAVQAKRYAPDNPVGIAAVQRTAGLLAEFDADRAAVVTSASFTRDAERSADAVDAVSLVDGERLCRWLTASPLAPPAE